MLPKIALQFFISFPFFLIISCSKDKIYRIEPLCENFSTKQNTQEEVDRKIVKSYTQFGFKKLNSELRKQLVFYKEGKIKKSSAKIFQDAEFYGNYHHYLNKALKTFPVNTGWLHRGIDLPQKLFEELFQENSITIDYAYASSTRRKSDAAQWGSIILKINSLSGRNITGLNATESMEEILLPPHSLMWIQKITKEKDLTEVQMKELNPCELKEKEWMSLQAFYKKRNHSLSKEPSYKAEQDYFSQKTPSLSKKEILELPLFKGIMGLPLLIYGARPEDYPQVIQNLGVPSTHEFQFFN